MHFRRGVALVGKNLYWHCSPHRGTPFQVQVRGKCLTRIWDLMRDEGWNGSQYMRQMSVISGHPIFTGFRKLTGCQRDPEIGVSQRGIRAKVYDYL